MITRYTASIAITVDLLLLDIEELDLQIGLMEILPMFLGIVSRPFNFISVR